MVKVNSNLLLYVFVVTACVLLWVFAGFSSALLCFGSFHLLMWMNVTVTALCNSLLGKPINGGDTLYRILCVIIASVCFAIVLA